MATQNVKKLTTTHGEISPKNANPSVEGS